MNTNNNIEQLNKALMWYVIDKDCIVYPCGTEITVSYMIIESSYAKISEELYSKMKPAFKAIERAMRVFQK